MLVIRLSRIGKNTQPSFRLIVQEKTSSPKRDALKILGFYHPSKQPKLVKIDKEGIEKWIKNGARPSDSVASLLKKNGFANMDKFIGPRDKKLKSKKEGSKTEATAPTA